MTENQCLTCKRNHDSTCVWDFWIAEDTWNGGILYKKMPFDPPCPHYLVDGGE